MSTTFWHDEPTVFAVDRETAFCHTLTRAVQRLGLHAEFYGSCEDFFDSITPGRRGCAAVDPQVLSCTVSELSAKLLRQGVYLPIVVVSTRGEVPFVVETIRAGALNYLQKPCHAETLAEALQEAIAWDAQHGRQLAEAAKIRRRLDRLSPGERQVLEMLVTGMTNQQVAAALGRSVRTIEVRRAKIREKMRAKSLADLICQSVAGVSADPGRRPRYPPK